MHVKAFPLSHSNPYKEYNPAQTFVIAQQLLYMQGPQGRWDWRLIIFISSGRKWRIDAEEKAKVFFL